MAEHFHALTVAEIVPETADARSIRFVVPDDLRGAYHFRAGQHLTLRATIEGEEVRRNYSLCTAEALDWCWRFVPELFEVDDQLAEAIESGIAVDPRVFEDEYRAAIGAVLGQAEMAVPADQRAILGGRRGHHSEHLGHLIAMMQFLPRTYPDAVW